MLLHALSFHNATAVLTDPCQRASRAAGTNSEDTAWNMS